MKKILFLLLAICAFVACDKGSDDTSKNITITGGDINQTIYADETSVNKGEGIKFTTTGAWRTEVEEVTKAVSWLQLNQTSGDKAGEYALKISLTENTTGKNRKATIKIICGDTIITITVEQKSTTESGQIPEEPKPIAKSMIDKITFDETNNGFQSTGEMTCKYDDMARLIEMTFTITEKLSADTPTTTDLETCTLTYGDGTTSYEYKKNKQLIGTGSCVLDKTGRVVSGTYRYDDGHADGQSTGTYTLEYDTNGYLSKSNANNSAENRNVIRWSNNNLTEVVWGNNNDGRDWVEYGTIQNLSNLDFSWMFVFNGEGFNFAVGDPLNIFAMIGRTGSRSKNMPIKTFSKYRSSSNYDEHTDYEYNINSEGYVTQFTEKHENPTTHLMEKGRTYKITYRSNE